MKYTREILEPLVKESRSISEVLKKLGLKQSGGSHSHLSKAIKREGVDVSHFTSGRDWNKGKVFGSSYPLEDYLSNKRYMNSSALRVRLIKDGVKDNVCEKCGILEWMGEELSLELHHIDCDHSNNDLSNLQILCPNCHCISHKKMRKNKPKAVRKKYKRTYARTNGDKKPILIEKAEIINPQLVGDNVRIAYPRPNNRKIERPPYDQLIDEIEKTSYLAVGKKYGVSDNAIRKWIKIYEKYGK
jgi:hypothetical protein